jgi:hypothetical protein
MHLRAGSLTGLNRFLILTPAPDGPESLLDSYTGTFLILTMHLRAGSLLAAKPAPDGLAALTGLNRFLILTPAPS